MAGSFNPATFNPASKNYWDNFNQYAADNTKGISRMPYVLNSKMQHSFADMAPNKIRDFIYPPGKQAASNISSLQSLLGLGGGGGSGLLGGGGGFGSGSLGSGSSARGGGHFTGDPPPVFGSGADWSFGGPILDAGGHPRGAMDPSDTQYLLNAYNDPRNYNGWTPEMRGIPIPGR